MSPQGRRGRPGGDGTAGRRAGGRAAMPELDRSACTACRGTGQVISGLGGEPHDVACPWCDGTGRFIAGHDAQQKTP